jgi:hypothetical protein
MNYFFNNKDIIDNIKQFSFYIFPYLLLYKQNKINFLYYLH